MVKINLTKYLNSYPLHMHARGLLSLQVPFLKERTTYVHILV